ncbi:hypothetical protein Dimus_035332 [Dionaea muscipula]
MELLCFCLPCMLLLLKNYDLCAHYFYLLMGTQYLFLFICQFPHVGSVAQFVLKKIISFIVGVWCSVSSSVFILFGFINKLFLRFQDKFTSPMSDSSSPTVSNRPETEEKVNDDGLDSMDSNIYYLSVYDIIERVMDSEGFGFAYEHSNNEEIKDEGDEEVTKSFLSFRFQSYGEFISGGGSMGTTDDFSEAGKAMNNELGRDQNNIEVCPKTVASLGDLGDDQEDTDAEKVSLDLGLEEFSGEDKTVSSDSDSDSIGSSDKFSIRSSLLHPFSDGFSSDSDSELSNTMEIGGKNVEQTEESHYLEKGSDLEDEDQDALQGLKSLETGDDATLDSESDEESKEGQFDCSFQKPETSSELETQWEHQELVEQLKMEIKKIRATGLPTIYEESDSLKIVLEDLKPWKIEDKCHQLQHHGTIREVHKFYKSYRERMRKFDIFNYQKMYAIDFLGLKNPLESFSSGTSSAGSVAAVILQECWPFKPNSHEQPSPITKFRRELDSDLEMFYVGQLCSSWEFLHWQYSKALELWESDPHGFLHYNEVAGEFQQFQVLLQRFLEDEPFKGPRVLNYVKSRCNQRHLLQVPVIRDGSHSKKRTSKGNEFPVGTSRHKVQKKQDPVATCFLRKAGHMKKDCPKYANWRAKQGILLNCQFRS